MKIIMAHGAGGSLTEELIQNIFKKYFTNETLDRMEDSAVLTLPSNKIAYTTDSFVITPLFFPGGDIGRLAVCGTVNDLLTCGAEPKYLSAGFILEEGLDIAILERVVKSMAETASEAGVTVVTGDTKVIEGRGGLYINTSGIGVINTDLKINSHNAADGDGVILSGLLGAHHAAILSTRMDIKNEIKSDCAPLIEIVTALLKRGIDIHVMRDVTRGGLATVLNEIAGASGVHITLDGDITWASEQVQGFCDILGLDPLYMGNEGVMALIVPDKDARKAVEIIRKCKYGESAQIIGKVKKDISGVAIKTRTGGTKIIKSLSSEGLPRIC